MFSQVRLFKVTGHAATGAPTLDTTAVKLLEPGASEREVNNISISLEPESTSRTYKADNVTDVDEYISSYNGTLTCYGISPEAQALLFGYVKDKAGNVDLVVNEEKPHICIFFRAKDEKGKKYQGWIYDCVFKNPTLSGAQPSDTPEETSISFTANILTVNGKSKIGAHVYEGTTGYIAEGKEPTSTDLYVSADAA